MPIAIQKNEHCGKDFKIKPLWGASRNNCIIMEQERDRSMIPTKTKKWKEKRKAKTIKSNNNYILEKVNVNVSKKICKLYTTYGRDNTKQAEMPYFHCGPQRQEKLQSG